MTRRNSDETHTRDRLIRLTWPLLLRIARSPRAGSSRGAVAQLGERGLCKPEVVGSIPSSSTMYLRALLRRDALALMHLRGALPLYKGVGTVMIFGSMDL